MTEQTLLFIRNSFGPVQTYDITPEFNYHLFESIKYAVQHEFGGGSVHLRSEEGLITGHFIVSENIVVEVPDSLGFGAAEGFTIWISGQDTDVARETKRALNSIFLNQLATLKTK